MVKHCGSSIQNIEPWRLWIWKNKFIIYLINHETAIDKVYLYAKDPYEAKYQFSINKQERKDLKDFSHSKAFIEHPIWTIFI